MGNFVSLIRRSDFNDLYRFGHLFVHNVIPFEGELSEHAEDKFLFDAVTAYMNTYEYSTEYLILHFNRSAFPGSSVEIFIKDVVAVYALDKDAHASLSASLDPRINLQVSCWTRFFINLSMKHSVRQSKAGMFNCFEIFGITEEERKRIGSLIPHNFVEDLFADLFSKKRPEGEKSIWTYLLRYERHHAYWNDMRGYFSDAIHVFENFKNKHEIDYEIADEVPLGDKLLYCGTNFSGIYSTIIAANPTQYSVEGCNYFAVAALYLYMHGLFKEGGITVTKLRQNPHLLQGTTHEQYDFDFALAVALLGIKLGQELTYSCYYEVQNLALFNRTSIKRSKLNEEMPLVDPIDGKRLSLDEAQDLLNNQYAKIDELSAKIKELEQNVQIVENDSQPQEGNEPTPFQQEESSIVEQEQEQQQTDNVEDLSSKPNEQEKADSQTEQIIDTENSIQHQEDELSESSSIPERLEIDTQPPLEEQIQEKNGKYDLQQVESPVVAEAEIAYSQQEKENTEGTGSNQIDEKPFEPVLMRKPRKKGKGFLKGSKYAHDRYEYEAFRRDGFIVVSPETENEENNIFKFNM